MEGKCFSKGSSRAARGVEDTRRCLGGFLRKLRAVGKGKGRHVAIFQWASKDILALWFSALSRSSYFPTFGGCITK